MGSRARFIQKMENGGVCLGTCITFSDPAVTEALSPAIDFAWIEMEHNPLSLETVQAHIMATKGTDCTPLVRVAWNDPVLIKPVLDIGAAEDVIVPMVRTANEAEEGCRSMPLSPCWHSGLWSPPSEQLRTPRWARVLPRR